MDQVEINISKKYGVPRTRLVQRNDFHDYLLWINQ